MHDRIPINLSSLAVVFTIGALAMDSGSNASAQSRTVSITDLDRSSFAAAGSNVLSDVGATSGAWSGRTSRSMAGRDPRSRSIGTVDHYSAVYGDGAEFFIDTKNLSVFHRTEAAFNTTLTFDVDSPEDADLTHPYRTWAGTALSKACAVAGIDYRRDSMTEISIWGEQSYRVDSGGLDISGDWSGLGNYLLLDRIDASGHPISCFDTGLEEIPNWNRFKDRLELEAGTHVLELNCRSVAAPSGPGRPANRGSTSMWLKLDWYDLGPGSANSSHDSTVARFCRAVGDDAAVNVGSSTEDLGSAVLAESVGTDAEASASETIRAEETGMWGRHRVSVDVDRGPRSGLSEAEAISEVDFTFYDDVIAHIALDGEMRHVGRGARARCRFTILNASGVSVWSDELRSGSAGHSIYRSFLDSVNLPAGAYTMRISTNASSARLSLAGDAEADCSFAIVFNERP